MRNVVYATNLTINGCCDHTEGNPDRELFEYFTGLLREADVVVYGRITYQLMFPYWADIARTRSETKAVNDFAQRLTEIDKVVFSRTLDSAQENTIVVHDNLREEILKLKQQPGKKISIGGVSLPTQLMALGLVDEFHFVVHPIISAPGKRMLDVAGLQETLKLKLVETTSFQSGCIGLHYVK